MTHTIGIDARMVSHTGIGTYLRGLFWGFEKTGLSRDWDISLFGKRIDAGRWREFPAHPFFSRIYSIEEQLEYPFRLKRCRLWHSPHYNVPAIKGKTKLVVTIHDLIHWIFRRQFFTPLQAFYAGKMLRRAVRVADHVITVSRKTKEDLIEHFNADPDRISVIYEGVAEGFSELEDKGLIDKVRHKYHLPENFFLYVGTLKPHKNVQWLVRLFKKLKREEKIEAILVLVGKKDKNYPPGFEELAQLRSEGGIIHLPSVESEELVAIYNGALALIHPSLYEGFGLTLLEAMACGTPVIASRAASIPEVAGEAAYLVDSCSEREMAEAIIRMEKVAGLREDLKKKGRLWVRRFRWEDAALQTASVYEKVLEAV